MTRFDPADLLPDDLLETLRGHSQVQTLIAPAKDGGKEPASAPPDAPSDLSDVAPASGEGPAPAVAAPPKANVKPKAKS